MVSLVCGCPSGVGFKGKPKKITILLQPRFHPQDIHKMAPPILNGISQTASQTCHVSVVSLTVVYGPFCKGGTPFLFPRENLGTHSNPHKQMAVVVKTNGIPFWLVGEFTAHVLEPILVVGLNRMFTRYDLDFEKPMAKSPRTRQAKVAGPASPSFSVQGALPRSGGWHLPDARAPATHLRQGAFTLVFCFVCASVSAGTPQGTVSSLLLFI